MTDNDNLTTTTCWLISGRVQGVGFRWFVTKAALECDVLDGTVRNLRDGRVEVVGRGRAACLEALELQLRRGPSASRVNDVQRTTIETLEIAPGFRVTG